MLECGESIVLTGTFSELNVIQSDITSVASTPCSLEHNLKRGNSKISPYWLKNRLYQNTKRGKVCFIVSEVRSLRQNFSFTG